MVELKKKLLMSEKELQKGVELMNSFGPRYTGSKAHKDFISYLKDEVHKLGFETYSVKTSTEYLMSAY